MQNLQMLPDVITYSAAISACEKCEQWQQALSLVAEIRSVEFFLVFCNSLDHVLIWHAYDKLTQAAFQNMQAQHGGPASWIPQPSMKGLQI